MVGLYESAALVSDARCCLRSIGIINKSQRASNVTPVSPASVAADLPVPAPAPAPAPIRASPKPGPAAPAPTSKLPLPVPAPAPETSIPAVVLPESEALPSGHTNANERRSRRRSRSRSRSRSRNRRRSRSQSRSLRRKRRSPRSPSHSRSRGRTPGRHNRGRSRSRSRSRGRSRSRSKDKFTRERRSPHASKTVPKKEPMSPRKATGGATPSASASASAGAVVPYRASTGLVWRDLSEEWQVKFLCQLHSVQQLVNVAKKGQFYCPPLEVDPSKTHFTLPQLSATCLVGQGVLHRTTSPHPSLPLSPSASARRGAMPDCSFLMSPSWTSTLSPRTRSWRSSDWHPPRAARPRPQCGDCLGHEWRMVSTRRCI